MQIEHIFNAVKRENNKEEKFINPQEFEIEYIQNYNKNYQKEPTELKDDFYNRYYYSLYPSDSDKIISKYDDNKIDSLVEKLGEDILMISGDFWGIQNFIFDGLTSDKASKILRSRSAMVQLITFVVVNIIKEKFKDSDSVLFGAGKFLILAKYEKNFKSKIDEIQKELDNYFLENFFGQNGFILSTQKTTKEKILNQDSKKMKEDLENLGKDNELRKLSKFNFLDISEDKILINPFREANSDDKICKFCSKRVKLNNKNEACGICDNQINLGAKLANFKYAKIYEGKNEKRDNIEIFEFNENKYFITFYKSKDVIQLKNNDFELGIFDIDPDYENKKIDIRFPTWSLGSITPKFENENNLKEPKSFSDFLKNDKGKIVSQGLIALKADVDKLGNTFREFYFENFKKFNRLSRELDFFFSDFATDLIAKKYNNLYVVFAGGDDLFLIGEYKEVIKFAKEIRDEFYEFSLKKATLSMGLVMFKPSTPINYISHLADDAEKRAKSVISNELKDKTKDEIEKLKNESKEEITRDGIDIFGISMKFNEFLDIEKKFQDITDSLKGDKREKTTFYYRLIELCDMRENINRDIKNAMWKSKLNYVIQRNMQRDTELYESLSELIDKFGEKFKPSIFLKIYENRDKNAL